jgi:hypothetical protein
VDRRETLKWMLAASAAMPLLGQRVPAQEPGAAATTSASAPGAAGSAPPAAGYGTDPDLLKVYHPGELWPLTLSEPQRRTAAVLCDLILPADERSPSASSVGVVEFLDEWVSAPYPRQRADRPLVIDGLAWLDQESARRFAKPFVSLTEVQHHAICDDICREPPAGSPFAAAATFFARFRDLTAGGFYSTPEGRRDIGYIGNVPQTTFEGPPPDVLRRVGL